MPSKYRRKKLKDKEYYDANDEEKKQKARVGYRRNLDIINERAKVRNKSDETLRKKKYASVKKRLIKDSEYKKKHNETARLYHHKIPESDRVNLKRKNKLYKADIQNNCMKRNQQIKRNSACQKQRLQNKVNRSQHSVRNCTSQAQRLLDSEKREQQNKRSSVCQAQRLLDAERRRQQNKRSSVCQAQRLLDAARRRQQNKRNSVCQVQRMLDAERRRQQNKKSSVCQAQRLLDAERRRQQNKRNSVCQAQRLLDAERRRQQNEINSKGQKQRLEDNIKRQQHRIIDLKNHHSKLQDDTERAKHQKINLLIQRTRLQTDNDYRLKNRTAAKINTTKRLNINQEYRELNKARAHKRQKEAAKQPGYKLNNKIRKFAMRHNNNSQRIARVDVLNNNRLESKISNNRKEYWIRRTKRLSIARIQRSTLYKQRKMSVASNINLLDVRLLFRKAEHRLHTARLKIKQLHVRVIERAEECLTHIPTDRTSIETDIDLAFDELRQHSSSGEMYFWELSYKTLSSISGQPIAVDEYGKAHVFESIEAKKPLSNDDELNITSRTIPDLISPILVTSTRQNLLNKNWHCNAQLCDLTNDSIQGTVNLLREITSANRFQPTEWYLHMDSCSNEFSERLGHSVHCSTANGCRSLLRPARTLSTHYPRLRTIIRRLYEVRQLINHVESVKTMMSSGSYDELNTAVRALDNLLNRMTKCDTSKNENKYINRTFCMANEENIMNKHGKALRRVTLLRDNYASKSCDICEQLRKDISCLKSYEGRKGFNTKEMEQIVDLLYQEKTRYEDIEKFMETTFICKYCADKLKASKNIPRSSFNYLSVVPTPECIQQLNIFEKILIKFTMTCLVIVRLGQVTNKNRPSNELTSALKGRIAYLPVDVSAQASFLPENLLNVDNLILLVGGQPTKQKRIWTSAVDLNKVHVALRWLKQNNHLYKDVPAYTIADIKKIITDRLEGHEQPSNNNTDKLLLKKLNEASKSFLYENFSVQPLNTSYPEDMLVDYQLSKVSGQSGDAFDSNLDLMAYPELFPTGQNGMRDTRRNVKIGTSDYIKSRLMNSDPKFRLNINYLFHCFQTQEISNMCHSVGHMLRTVSGNNLSAKAFSERLSNRDGEMQNNMFSLMANIRGSKEYFAKLAMNIRWMIKCLGPPTLFITCSTAEWFSQPFLDNLRSINSSVDNIDKMTPAELCAMDPVSVSNHFHQKWNAIFNHLIRGKEGIFGQVVDFFWRIEYQSRGAPHVHCILWIKDAPTLGKDSPERVKEFIETVLTCEKPTASESPTLSDLVNRFQQHKCNKYCMKSFKSKGKFYKKCRFGFPRPIKQDFQLNDIIDCLAVSKSKQPRKRIYHIRRGPEEVRINDYNPALLLANQANVDIQFIAHLGSRLPYYITDYMTKHERSEQDELWSDIFSSTKSLGSNAMSFMLKSIKNRQVGANEAADRLLGHKLYSSSRQIRFADLQPAHKAKRVLKPADEINRLLENDPDCQAIFNVHWVLDVYPDRPNELESTSLYSLLGWYEREILTGKGKEDMKLKTFNYRLRRRRGNPYLITHQVVNSHQSDEKKELYFYYLLKLFMPWRREEELQLEDKTFTETFETVKDRLPDMMSYHEANVNNLQRESEIEKSIKDRVDELRQDPQEDVEHEEGAVQGCVLDHAQTAMHELIEGHQRKLKQISNIDTYAAYNTLNADQKRVVDTVMTQIHNTDIPIRLFVSGQGGTGKSRVIEVLNCLISNEYKCGSVLPVVVTAPTGIAAFNIEGTTIHRVLNLPVEHGKPANYNSLNADQLSMLRATLKGLKLLIIDEVSMVSSLTLLYIHLRLTEIMSNNDLFGGLSIVFFADLLQLPPVKGNQPFIPVTFFEAKQRIGSVSSLDVWQSLIYDELTINMRQSADRAYADLLSLVRVGYLNDAHYAMLHERLIAPGRRATVDEISIKYQQLVDDGCSPLILMPTTALCNQINVSILSKIGHEIITLSAVDTLDTIVNKQQLPKIQTAYNKMDEDVTRTAGLEKKLLLCVGARVMLKRNKDVDAGLVNGAIGTVLDFNTIHKESQIIVTSVKIKFDTINFPINLERESFSFEVLKSVYYTRRQFPIMTAFAITIHKSQGLSLQSAILDAGSAAFGPGMIYVGLSRVTTIQGLHLVDFDRKKIKCDRKAVTEYNRLRKLYTPQLGDISAETVDKAAQKTNVNLSEKNNYQSAVIDNNSIPVINSTPINLAEENTHQNIHLEESCSKGTNYRKTDLRTTNHNVNINLPSTQQCVYNFCCVTSISSALQKSTCSRLNLSFVSDELLTSPRSEHLVSKQLQSVIYTETQRKVAVNIYQVQGDGNCLFRSISLAITGTQNQHEILRSYIVNHMMDEDVQIEMEPLFICPDNNKTYYNHLVNMEQNGCWGTDQEIVAAANLLNVSILCYSRYNENDMRIQIFSPHFAADPTCSNACRHDTLYLINSNGSHYNMATVNILTSNNSEE